MTVNDQLKIIDNKIKANQAQYDLDRLAAKISVYSSDDLRKYEYLTSEDLGYKPSVIQKAKIGYSPLGMSLSKAIKSSNDAKRPVKNNISLRYGSYSFVEFTHDAEKNLKIPSVDSKNGKVYRFLQCLVSSKSLL